MEMQRYRQLFLEESREHLTRMGQLLVFLEQAPADREALDELFRQAHSLKSMASAMGYSATTTLAHQLEESLAQWRAAQAMPPGATDQLLAGVDLLEDLLDDLAAGRPERDIGELVRRDPGAPATTVATADRCEPLLVYQVTIELATETAVPAARALLLLRELQAQGEMLHASPAVDLLRQGVPCRRLQVWLRTPLGQAAMEARLRANSDVELVAFVNDRRGGNDQRRWARADRTVRVRIDLLEQMVNCSDELLNRRGLLQQAARSRDWTRLDAVLADTAQLLDVLREDVLQTRLLPLESVTGRLPRLVRDLARAGDKQVELRLTGGGVLLDREILEELAEPLMHLVRNAVDHGMVAGVPGEVTVAGRLEPGRVLIEIADNGRGLEPLALKRQAVARGLLTASQAEALCEREALHLVCLPGFSTAPAVTEISGRGVGLDVVKTTVEKLGGTLEIVSAPGAGCRVRLAFATALRGAPHALSVPLPAGPPAAAAGTAPEVGHALS